ncbi:hypothetical protein dsx2_1837 [Desulfovibrio sp. X2]|nr:hypothetical protein dsx2_1837 [Desulfovibrio sp. X2]
MAMARAIPGNGERKAARHGLGMGSLLLKLLTPCKVSGQGRADAGKRRGKGLTDDCMIFFHGVRNPPAPPGAMQRPPAWRTAEGGEGESY